jgi:thiamine-monophosphate kinase
MIDTSDGLSTDLARICRASGVGAVVWAGKLPLPEVPQSLRRFGFDPLSLALHGGEDYELLFTIPRKLAPRLPRQAGGVPIRVIGEITRERGVLLDEGGRRRPLKLLGWDPFRTSDLP